MLKFIDEKDFLLVDEYRENEDGSVSWSWDDNGTMHMGIIREGFTREHQVQTGTQTVVTGQEPVLDAEGNPVLDENGEPVMQDVTDEQPVFETQTIDVWSKLWELHNDPDNPVTIKPVDIAPIKAKAVAAINQQRDALIRGGVQFNGHTYQTDVQSIMDIMGAVLAGTDTQWLTADNVVVPMTVADLQALGQAVAAHKASLVYQARTHKDAVLAMTSITDIENYLAGLTWS